MLQRPKKVERVAVPNVATTKDSNKAYSHHKPVTNTAGAWETSGEGETETAFGEQSEKHDEQDPFVALELCS